MRNIVPGWRYFFCLNCNEQSEPYKYEPHPEWPVDAHGNLLEDE